MPESRTAHNKTTLDLPEISNPEAKARNRSYLLIDLRPTSAGNPSNELLPRID